MVFIEQIEKQKKDTKQLEKQVNKASYEQRQYNNLSFLYANSNIQQQPNNLPNTSSDTVEPNIAATNIQYLKGDINV